MKTPEELTELFRSSGRKVTAQRQCIFRVLQGDVTHPSAEAVHAAKVRVIDTLGCLIGAFFGEPGRVAVAARVGAAMNPRAAARLATVAWLVWSACTPAPAMAAGPQAVYFQRAHLPSQPVHRMQPFLRMLRPGLLRLENRSEHAERIEHRLQGAREVRRSGPGYTVDTLIELRRR